MEMTSTTTTIDPNSESEVKVRVRVPKRILHFSDGTLEEFSDDDEEDVVDNKSKALAEVDEASLEWLPWIMHKTWKAGFHVLSVCDYLGETFASVFGITTPKYNSEIEEFERNREEAEKEKMENAGWSTTEINVLSQPESREDAINENIIIVKEKF